MTAGEVIKACKEWQGGPQLKDVVAVLESAVKVVGVNRADVIATLLGALAAICVCGADGDSLFQTVQDELAHVRTLYLAATTSPVPA